MLTGGHAANALPQMARANVNCRIIPGEDPEAVRKTLETVAADPKVIVTIVPVKQATARWFRRSASRHLRYCRKWPRRKK